MQRSGGGDAAPQRQRREGQGTPVEELGQGPCAVTEKLGRGDAVRQRRWAGGVFPTARRGSGHRRRCWRWEWGRIDRDGHG
jgi:hypothetical protein